MEVEGRKTYLIVPHEGEKISFQYPAFKGNFGSLAKQIDTEGLERPTSAQIASLVYDALTNPNGEYESKIIEILKHHWFVEFTGNLYLPKKQGEEVHNGVIIEANPIIKSREVVMHKSSLIKRLNQNDPNVKFVPFGYKIREQTSSELAKNPYILARYGEKGAEKVAEISSKYKKNPKLGSFSSVDKELISLSALNYGRLLGNGLYINGNYWHVDNNNLSFGAKK